MVAPPTTTSTWVAADGSDHILGGTPIVTGAASDYQPALSPDGEACFTHELSGTGKDVYTVPATGGTGTPLLTSNGTQEYECAWSPDGQKIAFVRGAFAAGQILMLNSDGSGSPDNVTDVAGRFDGNPEWTRNPRPRCADRTAQVARNGFERVALDCTDAQDPPSFQNDDLEVAIDRRPAHGTLSGIGANGSVIYTPDANFVGRDTFTYTANDGTSTSTPATVTLGVGGVDVTPPAITRVRVFPRTWQRGRRLPRASARTGTRISWRLSEAARVRIVFQRKRGTRFRRAGTLALPNAHQGLNAVRFQGRLSRRKRLKLGTYRLVIGATDAAGNKAAPRRSKTFRIVAR